MIKTINSILENLVFGGSILLSGISLTSCSPCFPPRENCPKSGVYEIRDSDNNILQAELKGSWLYSDYGPIRVTGPFITRRESNIIGDPCTDCNCPQDAENINGLFLDDRSFRATVEHINYCRIYKVEIIEGYWISEDED